MPSSAGPGPHTLPLPTGRLCSRLATGKPESTSHTRAISQQEDGQFRVIGNPLLNDASTSNNCEQDECSSSRKEPKFGKYHISGQEQVLHGHSKLSFYVQFDCQNCFLVYFSSDCQFTGGSQAWTCGPGSLSWQNSPQGATRIRSTISINLSSSA